MKKNLIFLLIIGICLPNALLQTVSAQDTTIQKKDLKNTIHVNLTNSIIFGSRTFIVGYERVIGKHQSFTVNVGPTSFPRFGIINSDSISANRTMAQSGYHISADYRFYLAKENKYNAPRGVYIGPYYALNYFSRENSWKFTSTSGGAPQTINTKTSLTIHNVGFELGYQFIFWRRLALDLVLIGPGIAGYNLKASFGSNLSLADKEKLLEKLNEALAEKFPGYNFVIDDLEFQKKGSTNTTTIGYRYIVQLGFRF